MKHVEAILLVGFKHYLRRLVLWFLHLFHSLCHVLVDGLLFNLPELNQLAFLYHLKYSLPEGRLGSYAHYAFLLLLFDFLFLALLLES